MKMLLPSLCCLTAALCAQQVPVPNAGGRQLQLFDVSDLLSLPAQGPDLRLPTLNDDPTKGPASLSPTAALTDFLRHSLVPPLGQGDDLQPIAGRLAMVARPADLARLESLLATNRARQSDMILVEVRLVRFNQKDFEAVLRDKLVATERDARTMHEQVFPAKDAKAVLDTAMAKGTETLDLPRLTVKPLNLATVSHVTQTAYVRDFTLTPKGKSTIAEPIVDTVWSGLRLELITGFEADGTIVVSCDFQSQELVSPIPTVEVDLGLGAGPAKVQLPRTIGMHLRQIAHVHAGDLVVIAAQQAKGDYLAAFLQTGVATGQPK